MEEIYKIGVTIAGYLGCVAIGALVSWHITKSHYEKIVDEEVQSIREVKERKSEEVRKNKPRDFVEEYLTVNNDHPKEDVHCIEPYLITMETFDDADPTYEKIMLDYYTDNKCLVENDMVINPNETVGADNLARFDKRNDLVIMYVRNENICVDYEVTKIVSEWTE